jgi:hypothetical protein
MGAWTAKMRRSCGQTSSEIYLGEYLTQGRAVFNSVFNSDRSLVAQHAKSVHTSVHTRTIFTSAKEKKVITPSKPPFLGASGKWFLRQDFPGQRAPDASNVDPAATSEARHALGKRIIKTARSAKLWLSQVGCGGFMMKNGLMTPTQLQTPVFRTTKVVAGSESNFGRVEAFRSASNFAGVAKQLSKP